MRPERTPYLLPPLLLLLLRAAASQYSSDQCSWRGSGLTHEAHARDVEQVYLRCSQGALEWLYPTGALIVNLRPNILSPAAQRLAVCIKPSGESRGANIYLEKAGRLQLLLREEEQPAGQVHCFGIEEGSLFIEATPRQDISRKITAFQYELVNHRPGADPSTAPCQPCSDSEVLLAVCSSDFVARGSIVGVQDEAEQHESVISVSLSRLIRQKSRVFVPAGGRAPHWRGQMRTPLECGVKPGDGDFLFTGAVRFGEAWLGCAPRFKDFLRLYGEALDRGTNPCHIDTA